MSNFFKPTAAELDSAVNGDKAVFKNNELAKFQISEIKQKQMADGTDLMIVQCKVIDGDQKGKEYSHFIKPHNTTSMGIWYKIMEAFYARDIIEQGNLSPVDFIGKTMASTAKLSTKGDKTYCNFYNFEEVSDVPSIGGDDRKIAERPSNFTSDDIPF